MFLLSKHALWFFTFYDQTHRFHLQISISGVFRLYGLSRVLADLLFEQQLLASPNPVGDTTPSGLFDTSATRTPPTGTPAPGPVLVCRALSLLNAVLLGFLQFSFATVVVERWVATVFHASYEEWGSRMARRLLGALTAYALAFGLLVLTADRLDLVPEAEEFATCVLVVRRPALLVFR